MRVAEFSTFTEILRASGRSPEIPEAADAYGWLVGSWALDCRRYTGEPVSIKGEAHFGWVLEGRAIQDVWIMPSGSERNSLTDKTQNMFGTTLRVWDSSFEAWRIIWRNPVHNHWEDQIGRWSGKDANQMVLYRNQSRFVSLARRSIRYRRPHLETRRGILR